MTSFIANGVGNMPAYARILTPDEMNAIVAFLATRTSTTGKATRHRRRISGTEGSSRYGATVFAFIKEARSKVARNPPGHRARLMR
jgi:hypothetical protein